MILWIEIWIRFGKRLESMKYSSTFLRVNHVNSRFSSFFFGGGEGRQNIFIYHFDYNVIGSNENVVCDRKSFQSNSRIELIEFQRRKYFLLSVFPCVVLKAT